MKKYIGMRWKWKYEIIIIESERKNKYKNGERYYCRDCRGITMLCVGMKIFEKIFGFRKRRNTQEQFLWAFTDPETALDRILRKRLREILERRDTNQKLKRIIKNI